MTEWNPNDYARHSTLQETMAAEQLALLTLTGSEHVLDVGCGVGNITAQIATRVPHGSVVGVDPSWDMIAFASNLYARSVHPNLRFEVADARCLPFENEFDLVVSFNALHWVPEQEKALRSLHATLKPAGRALLRFVPAGPRRSIEDVIEDTRKSERWRGHFDGFEQPYAHFSADEYRALAMRSGFSEVAITIKEKAWDFKSREGMAGFCKATFIEWTRHLPEADRPAFISDVLDRYRLVAMEPPHPTLSPRGRGQGEGEAPGEENTFKFYQMEVALTR